MKPESFQRDIFTSVSGAVDAYRQCAVATYRAQLPSGPGGQETEGADAALAALKQNLASMAKEKESRQSV